MSQFLTGNQAANQTLPTATADKGLFRRRRFDQKYRHETSTY
jgi:hypothetical protein